MTKIRGANIRRPPSDGYTAAEWVKGYAAWIVVLPLYITLWIVSTCFPQLPKWLVAKLLRAHGRECNKRPQDIRIPGDTSIPAYMLRWWKVRRNAFFNIYFHIVKRSDDDTALHDHPWWNFSILLHGAYIEHQIREGGVHVKTRYREGACRFRRSGSFAHRLELERYPDDWGYGLGGTEKPVFTIFITGPTLRRWGFHHTERWVDAYDWDDFCRSRGLNTTKMDGYAEQLKGPNNAE
jgi:hypothetical protein